jgi:ADP-ribosylglycohydrolase
VACLHGVATGDAIGKQTETLARDELLRWYPRGLSGFEGVPGDVIPRYVKNRKREWRIGETTDDTERTLAVARTIIRDRKVSHEGVGREMLQCTKCIHPGLKSSWEFHQAGDPARIAQSHDGCGAAVRVAAVGIFFSSERLDDLVSGAREASISTHGGSLAIAAAAATAAAVSAAVDAGPSRNVLELAGRAAEQIDRTFAAAMCAVRNELASLSELRPADVAARCFPDGPLTIVPLALALATLMRSAERAILLAANVGGDSDSVASIAGGILGAMYPDTVNRHWVDIVERENNHNLPAAALELARLRH